MTTKISKRMPRLNVKRRMLCRVSVLRRSMFSFWDEVLACWIGKSARYSQLPRSRSIFHPSRGVTESSALPSLDSAAASGCDRDSNSSDLVALKISLLGDCHIGKTSFLTKYVGRESAQEELASGVNQMDKTLCVKGARISYSIWEVAAIGEIGKRSVFHNSISLKPPYHSDAAGDDSALVHIPAACKDSVAMLFMFDLTSRCTLHSVIKWYKEARKWNQSAIPVLIGTKFDDFIQLPIDLQWTIASQARAYAKALNATLFFSSATYNINVNKIFKFVTAKLFNLPWSLERNLTIGEPMIDF